MEGKQERVKVSIDGKCGQDQLVTGGEAITRHCGWAPGRGLKVPHCCTKMRRTQSNGNTIGIQSWYQPSQSSQSGQLLKTKSN